MFGHKNSWNTKDNPTHYCTELYAVIAITGSALDMQIFVGYLEEFFAGSDACTISVKTCG